MNIMNHKNIRKIALVVLFVIGLLLGVYACGDDDDAETPEPVTTTIPEEVTTTESVETTTTVVVTTTEPEPVPTSPEPEVTPSEEEDVTFTG